MSLPARGTPVPRAAAAFAIAAGLLVLLGGMLHDERMATLYLGLGSMQANCAAAFVLAGISLALSRSTGALSRPVAMTCAWLVTAMALATVTQYLLRSNLFPLELLFRPGPTFLSSPAEDARSLAPLTGLAFAALGLALLAVQFDHPRWSQALVLPLLLVTHVAVVGYAYGIRQLYAYPGQGTTSLPTALTFTVLAVGVLGLRPDVGLLRPLASDTPSGAGARRLLPAAIAVTLLLGWARLQGERAGIIPAELALPITIVITISVLSALVFWGARSAVAADEERSGLASIVESSGDAIYSEALDGAIQTWNPGAERLYGYAAEDAVGKQASSLVPPDGQGTFAAMMRQVHAGERVEGYETTRQRRDGTVLHLALTVSPVKNASGHVTGIATIARDITDRHGADEAMRKQGERLRLAVEGAALGTWHADIGTGELIWSDRCCDLFGLAPGTPTDLAGFRNALHPDDRQAVEAAIGAALAGGKFEIDTRIVWADGSEHWLAVRGRAYFDAERRPDRMEGVVREITEQKRLEEQLRQAQKMDAVGRLAGGVAHDFNNLLGVILGYGELLLRRMDVRDPLRGKVQEMLKAGERAAGLTRQLLAFSRKQILQPKVLDLAAVVDDMSRMLARLIGEDITLVTATREGLLRVRADPSQLEQILMNLAVNARDAMPGGGSLTIETSAEEIGEAYAALHDLRPGWYTLLTVTDTGTGMNPDTVSHLFEPFFTTKEEGKGTGLGLATVYGIVKQSDGHIAVSSDPGRGTTFRIYLPSVRDAPLAAPAPARDITLPSGSETVLLVEDSDALREVAREILEELGYRVIEAPSSEKALEQARHLEGSIHLLLTDVVMPGMSGRELWERLSPSRPECRVLFMSGYTDDAILQHGVLESEAGFLSKPFSSATLARKVRQVLDRAL